jgi:signal transduction histidine kinase/CheY-like chemotaxis protein/CHASE3 domain sensor protein
MIKLSVKRKLNIGFAAAILLVVLVGGLSIYTFDKQNAQAQLVKQSYQVINKVQHIQRLLADMETGERGFRSTNNAIFLEPYQIAGTQIHQAIQDLTKLSRENQTLLEEVNALKIKVDGLLAFWSATGQNVDGYSKDYIARLMQDEKVRMDGVRTLIDSILKDQNNILIGREKENRQAVRIAIGELLIGVSLILFIVIALIYQTIKEFRIRRIAEEKLSDYNKELEAVNEERSDRNWLLAGLAEINNALQGYKNVEELSGSALKSLAAYVQAEAAGFYIYDEEKKQFELKYGYGLPASAKKVFNNDEGFLGRAFDEQKLFVVKDVDHRQVVIESALIKANPAEIIYLPVCLNDELKGVIELLKFGSFNESTKHFLKSIANNIGVAIQSSQSREKVTQLLNHVKEQKEVLENQQEELRQANEELSLQTEVLQASEEELRVQEEELRQINAELEEKNEAVETARHSLILKTQELESISRYKSDFLANMSHELRTPLNSILILARLLSENSSDNLNEKQVSHAKIIYKSGSDLLQLINDILDLAKIEAGKMEVFSDDVPVSSIANDLQQLFGMLADEKRIQFNVTVDPDVPQTIIADKQKVEQVLRNLLSNAFKFTSANGKVSLDFGRVVQDGNEFISMFVTDTGIGIPAANQQLIFDAFQQADSSTNRKYGGTGLGLSITSSLLKLLSGKISLQSEEGKGSTFTVLLPLMRADGVQHDTIIGDNKTGQQVTIDDDRTSMQAEDKIMLIIEDDRQVAQNIQELAKSKGYKTVLASKGDEGLALAKKYLPAAIILDIKLPGMDGSTVLKTLKADPALKHIPVHIISATDDASYAASGALAFLKKPFRKEDIEGAFTLIEDYLKATVKRVLILSNGSTNGHAVRNLLSEKEYKIQADIIATASEALPRLRDKHYDTILADITTKFEEGLEQLKWLHDQLHPQQIPTIIYIDEDISPRKELELKKISDVVVRKSEYSNARLMDELELFFYKVKEDQQKPAQSETDTVASNILENKKVLLVDDDMRNVFALNAALEQEQMQVITASDGNEALALLQEQRGIDIVLMDVMMPDMDGYEAMKMIRSKLMMKDLPIIALTAKAMAGDKEKCIEAGASDYISKPVNVQKLVSLMRVWLS